MSFVTPQNICQTLKYFCKSISQYQKGSQIPNSPLLASLQFYDAINSIKLIHDDQIHNHPIDTSYSEIIHVRVWLHRYRVGYRAQLKT